MPTLNLYIQEQLWNEICGSVIIVLWFIIIVLWFYYFCIIVLLLVWLPAYPPGSYIVKQFSVQILVFSLTTYQVVYLLLASVFSYVKWKDGSFFSWGMNDIYEVLRTVHSVPWWNLISHQHTLPWCLCSQPYANPVFYSLLILLLLSIVIIVTLLRTLITAYLDHRCVLMSCPISSLLHLSSSSSPLEYYL